MASGRLHAEHRLAGILYKLLKNHLIIVKLLVLKACERAYTYNVTVTAHNRNGLKQVLRLVTVHYNTTLGLKFPRSGVNIEHYCVHSKVHSRLLCAETGAQA